MRTGKYFALIIVLVSLIIACSKNNDKNDSSGDLTSLTGRIYYDYAGSVNEIDLNSGNQNVYFSINAYSFNNWDLSQDGKIRLISERLPGTSYTTRFKLTNAQNQGIINEFDYTPPRGNSQSYGGTLSPDNSMIVIPPDHDNGIVILDTAGKIRYHIEGINNMRFTSGDEVKWLPGNGLLLTLGEKLIFKAEPPYAALTLVKDMGEQEWGNINASPDGSRISFFIENHICLMDITGDNLVQVTDSDVIENTAVFSPDGKWLLVGTNYVHAPASGRTSWQMKIIPADGKMYNLDDSPQAIPVIPRNEGMLVKSSGRMMWRP